MRVGPVAICLIIGMLAITGAPPATPVRTVLGTVTDPGGRPLKSAVVQLENLSTLRVRSFVTSEAGTYRFRRLSPNVDYSVKAQFGGRWSSTELVSRFDLKNEIKIDLVVPVRSGSAATSAF